MKSPPKKPVQKASKRILILDDHPMTRRGLIQLINCEKDLMVCAEAGGAQLALASMRTTLPDLVLADLSLSGKSGLEFIKDMQALHPDVPVLVLSMHDENVYAERVLRAGGRGYIMKTEGGEKLLAAIRQVLQGKTYVSEGLSAAIIDSFAKGRANRTDAALGVLTDREFEIFELFGKGLSTREIGRQLNLSVATVRTHRMHIKSKLNFVTGAQLTQHAICWVAGGAILG